MLGVTEDKRQVPKMLQKILQFDVQVTKKFVDIALKNTALRSLRNHAKFLEVSCHGIVWLAGWLTFIWLFNNKDLYQVQVNMLIALLLDIIVIAVVKAFVRRRRPVPMNKLMAVGPDKYSFPSGHASRSVLIAFMLTCLSPVSIIFYPPLLAWVGSVSLSRVLLERHYFLDVLAGCGIGILEGLAMTLLLDIIVIAVVKAFVRRRRPVPMNKLMAVGPDKYSFPSGHASRSVLIAFMLTCLSPVSIIFYPPLLAWVGSVSLSRVLLERHYFLDVLAGCGIGILEGLAMSLIWFSQSTSASILSSLSDEKLDGGEFHV